MKTKQVDPTELINAQEVAPMIGLTNPGGVSVYRRRFDNFPTPVVDKGLCVLWLRSDIEVWAKGRA